ncbi:MAG TPA: hypothetical protein VK745_29935 [Polyangiaceae bacterium]|nr:hypothetical protein [Polyangiaceae bacterium]
MANSGGSYFSPSGMPQAAGGSGSEVDASPGEPASDAGFCTGQAVSVADLASGNVRGGATVLLPKLVVTSQKFLLSASKTSDKCLWGAFATDEGKSGENSGVLLLSSVDGVPAESDGGSIVVCPSGMDALPDALAPGDRVSAFGDFSDYAPSACRDTAPMRELLVKPGCAVERTGQGVPPATVMIPFELADQLAQGKDKALLRAWSGARVELDALDALPVAGSASAVGAFGVIRVQQTKLELHSKIPYSDLSEGGPHQPAKALDYSFPVHFARARGVLFLDYCTWSLGVCEPCLDLAPQSRGCPASGG